MNVPNIGLRISLPFLLVMVQVSFGEMTNLTCGLNIDYTHSDSVPLGSNVTWKIVLVNTSNVGLSCHSAIDVNATTYDGRKLCDIADCIETNTIPPSQTNQMEVCLTPSNYAGITGTTLLFAAHAFISVIGSNEVWIRRSSTELITPNDFLQVSPTGNVSVGNSVVIDINYRHPVETALDHVDVLLSADDGFSTNDVSVNERFTLGSFTNGQSVTMTTNLVARKPGQSSLTARIVASNFVGTSASTDLTIIPQGE